MFTINFKLNYIYTEYVDRIDNVDRIPEIIWKLVSDVYYSTTKYSLVIKCEIMSTILYYTV